MITVERNIDMVPGGEPVTIHLSQYDGDFTNWINVNLTDGRITW